MKILQVANNDFFSTYGGGQVYVKNLVDEMINQGLDVIVISKTSVNNQTEEVVLKKYRGISMYEFSKFDKDLLKEKIRQINPDILHVHADKALLSEICKELSIPCVITAHHGGITCPAGTLLNYQDEICRVAACQKNCLSCVLKGIRAGYLFYPILSKLPVSWRLATGRFLRRLPFIYFVTPVGISSLIIENKQAEWNKICQNVDLMIAPSHAIAENMILNGLKASKIKIVPHGIPINSIKNNTFVPDMHNHTIDTIKFFYVGRIGYIKGIHILLEAFAKLKTEVCELHVIGDIKNRYAKKLIEKYSRNKNIVFHGKVAPEVVALKIKEYDILIHPTICMEIFGLNIAEALAEGKPVIATRCGGAEMQIKESENGLLIAPNSVEELLHAMDWAINHPEDINRMSKNAPLGVISMSEHVKTIEKIYHNLVK